MKGKKKVLTRRQRLVLLRAAIMESEKVIAKERDRLRDLIAEAQELGDCAADVTDMLEYAVDRLSQRV